ncbi:MAG TPA: class I tRNA ligase family protein, partial [Vicinamibacteria bacterium]
MTSVTDLKATLNLPQTDFPMKANLPQAEPKRLATWKADGLYRRLRDARRGAQRFVLHDGPPYANGHIHLGTALNKILKDVIVRSRSLMGFDAPYVPGWDCHGLPIELQVDKNLGSKKKDLSPVAFRKECRKYAEKFLDIQRGEFERLGVMGEWEDPYLTMAPSYQAAIVRELAAIVERGLVYKAKKSVHWCISCRTALAEAEVEYDENHESPWVDVRFELPAAELAKLGPRAGAVKGPVFGVIWTTTPWTLPANLALAFHPEADYGFYPVEGRGEVVVAARALRDAVAERWAVRLGEPLLEVKGAEMEGLRFRHPWIDRDSPA